MDLMDVLENPEHLENQVDQDFKEHLDEEDLPDHKDQEEAKESKDQLVKQVLLEFQEFLEKQDPVVNLDPQETEVLLVIPDLKVNKDHKVCLDL